MDKALVAPRLLAAIQSFADVDARPPQPDAPLASQLAWDLFEGSTGFSSIGEFLRRFRNGWNFDLVVQDRFGLALPEDAAARLALDLARRGVVVQLSGQRRHTKVVVSDDSLRELAMALEAMIETHDRNQEDGESLPA